jgi:hypothetical protein
MVKLDNKTQNMDAYEIGIKFVDTIVKKYPEQIAELASETTGKDYTMVSTQKLTDTVKELMKNQNEEFITKLASFLATRDRSRFEDIEVYFGAGGVTIDTAISDLGYTKAQYTSDPKVKAEVDKYFATISSGGAAEDTKDGSKLDWNKVLDTTGKVAQSIFFLGNAFSQREDQPVMPTLTDVDNQQTVNRQRMIRNVVIGGILLIGLGVGFYFAFRKKA